MISNLMKTWSRYSTHIQKHWQKFGYLLTVIGLLYVVGLLIISGFNINQIRWQDYWQPVITAIGLYVLSLILQYYVWSRMISFHHSVSWIDVVIYSRVLLMRRLPGGIWHWVDRTVMYSGTTNLPTQVIMLANFLEWALLILVAVGIVSYALEMAPYLRLAILLITTVLSVGFAYNWQPSKRSIFARLTESVSWVSVYLASWIIGGLIVLLFVRPTQASEGINPNYITLAESTWLWAISGGISLLMIIIPAGLGIREITLTWLLQPYLSIQGALLVAILIRFTFILADIFWGTLGLTISLRFLKARQPSDTTKQQS